MSGYINSDGSGLVGGLTPSQNGLALQLDASGNLKVASGTADGLGNLSVQDYTKTAITQGKAFLTSTGLLNLAAGTYALSVFNPAASGKSLLIYSARLSSGGSSINAQLNLVTSNPGFGNVAPTFNAKAGGAASVALTTYASTTQTPTGSLLQVEQGAQNTVSELFSNKAGLLLPVGNANGIVAYITTFANGYLGITLKWLEY